MEKYTIMEMMLMQQYGEENLDRIIKEFKFENSEDVEYNKKSTYVELTGEVVCRLDS